MVLRKQGAGFVGLDDFCPLDAPYSLKVILFLAVPPLLDEATEHRLNRTLQL